MPKGQPDHLTYQCPLDTVLRLLMGPWTTYIIWLLQTKGPLRFGQIKAEMGRISSKVLTERLRHLESAGLVSRTYVATIPPSVTYALTSRGDELRDILEGINDIAVRWAEEDLAAAREKRQTPPLPAPALLSETS